MTKCFMLLKVSDMYSQSFNISCVSLSWGEGEEQLVLAWLGATHWEGFCTHYSKGEDGTSM